MTLANTPMHRSPNRLLWWKEYTESKPALWVGLLIFVMVPSLWTLIMRIIDPQDGLFPGFATGVWLLTGWLFAAVLGAQVVCRDFGTPLERFLLGKPITPTQSLKVKARVGFVVLVVTALVIAALECLWFACEPSHRKSNSYDDWSFLTALVVATGLNVSAFWIAFGVACVTRRSLVSTLAATFVLVLFVCVPLIVPIPGLPGLTDLIFRESNIVNAAWVFVCLVGASWAIAFALRRIWGSRERGLEVGPRQLAWVAALTLLGLFFLAMNEVGASQPLTTVWWHSKWPTWTGAYSDDRIPFMFAVGRQRVAVSADDRTIRLIDLDSIGRFASMRQVERLTSSQFLPEFGRVWAFDNENTLAMVRNSRTSFREGEPLSNRVRLEMRKLDWDKMTALPSISLPWPPDQELPESCHVTDAYFIGSRLFVWLNCWRGKKWFPMIIAYQFDGVKAVALISNVFPSQELWSARFQNVWDISQGKPVRKLAVLGDYGDMSFCFDPNEPAEKLRQSIKHPYLTDRGVILPRSDRWGFKVRLLLGRMSEIRERWPADSEGVIGRVRASPWATLFRSEHPRPLAAGPNRWIELHETHAIVYDLTDPSHPKRIAHISTPPFWNAAVTDDFIVFDHSIGISVAKLPVVERK
jgi:ABC-type transport system involved in multi-copper enzyme maturation permease subunit